MEIFISYGHGDHTEIVDRVCDALVQAGYEIWKDDVFQKSSGIASGQDFEEVIKKKLEEADFVLAFLSQRTLASAYCKDERNWAYNHKDSHFIQILLEKVDILQGNSRSYIDLSNVVDTTGRINEKLFENACNGLFAAFRDPKSFAEGGINPRTKLERHLCVPGALRYEEFITMPAADDFVGRQWLVEQCKAWALDSTIRKRLFVILGEAGTGKTAFVRHLAQDRELVRSVHVCIYNKTSTRSLRDTLKDLAYVLACGGGAYFEYLEMKNLEQLQEMSEDALFEYLFLEPMKDTSEKYLLIIDGLDEMEATTGLKPLIKIFRQYADRINPNVSFLVTTRPDEEIVRSLRSVESDEALKSVTLDQSTNEADLRCFIRKKLAELGHCSEDLEEKLLEACDGNFEYLSLLFKEAAEEGLQVSADMKLPKGLDARYIQYLERRMEQQDQSRLTKHQRRLLSVLCVGCEPMPLSLLAAAAGMDRFDAEEELALFGSLLRQEGSRQGRTVALFAKSFRDFLLRDQDLCGADRDVGLALVAGYILKNCQKEADLQESTYLERHAVTHLLQYAPEAPEAVIACLQGWQRSGSDIALLVADALEAEPESTVTGYSRVKDALNIGNFVEKYLKGKRALPALEKLLSQYEKEGNQWGAMLLEADLLLWDPTPEKKEIARRLYTQLLDIAAEQYAEAPDYSTCRDLAITYDRLGVLARTTKPWEAEGWYRKALPLFEQNHRENPCYESRRDLAITYDRLGNLVKATKPGEAEGWYRKELELNEEKQRENPCYESRRDLAITYGRLGDLVRATNPGEAEGWYRKRLALDEENHRENPCYESRRGLAITYGRLGDLVEATNPGEAEGWCRKELELFEQNHRENPCYESRRDLADTYDHLGDLTRTTKPGEAEAWYRKELALDEENHRENPCYQSRRGLALTYGRMGDLVRVTNPGEAEGWYRKKLALDEENHRENPCYESRCSLAVAYERLGDLVKATQPGEAEAWYRKDLELEEQNHRENPCYESRCSLAIHYNRLGDLVQATKPGEAEAWYRKALELFEENHRENPCYESRRGLAVTYERLGNLAKATNPGEAEGWYRKKLALDEENHRENPCYQSRQDLAVTYDRLGALAKATKPGEAEIWYRKELELNEENHRESPCYQSRRDLALTYGRLGILTQKKDPAEAKEWYQKALALLEENARERPGDEAFREALRTEIKGLEQL